MIFFLIQLKCLLNFSTLASSLQVSHQGPYSEHLIFFVTYIWVQKALSTRIIGILQHPSLMCPYLSYAESAENTNPWHQEGGFLVPGIEIL